MLLTRENILGADDHKLEKVECPEWGGFVYVRDLSGTERDSFEQASVEGKGKNVKVNLANLRARLCALTICDEKRQSIFLPEDVAELGNKSSAPLDRIFDVAQRLSGLRKEDVEELTKNS